VSRATPAKGASYPMRTERSQVIRILHYNHTSRVSGAENILLTIVENLDRANFQPVVTAPQGCCLGDEVNQRNIPFVSMRDLSARFTRRPDLLMKYAASSLLAILAFRRIVRAEQPHVIHANSIRAGLVATLATRGMRVPVLWHVHDILPPHPLSPLIRAVAAFASGISVVSVSQATAARFEGKYLRRLLRCLSSTLYNGIDTERFTREQGNRARVREALALSSEDFCIGHIGQFSERKNQLGMVRAFAELLPQMPNAVLLLVGAPLFTHEVKYAQQLEQEVHNLRIEDRVRFLGQRSDIPSLMQALDLLVVNSRQEPLALTVVEGFSARVPVLGSRVGGIPEMIEHGVTGWLISAPDRHSLARDMLSIARNPPLAKRVSEAAFALATSKFTLDSFMQGFSSLVERTANPYRDIAVVSEEDIKPLGKVTVH
jgi:L-malate glycosyltransferase